MFQVVIRKYYLYLLVALGIWTDEAYEAFDIHAASAQMSNDDPKEISIKLVPLIVGSRSILLQVKPTQTLLYVYKYMHN